MDDRRYDPGSENPVPPRRTSETASPVPLVPAGTPPQDEITRLREIIGEKDRQIDALAAIGRTITSTLVINAIARSVYAQLRAVIAEEKMRTFYMSAVRAVQDPAWPCAPDVLRARREQR